LAISWSSIAKITVSWRTGLECHRRLRFISVVNALRDC